MHSNCPNSAQCPIFKGVLSDKAITAKSYRRQFCESSTQNWKACKRFMTKQAYGQCPSYLLPNSSLSIAQIGLRYSLA